MPKRHTKRYLGATSDDHNKDIPIPLRFVKETLISLEQKIDEEVSPSRRTEMEHEKLINLLLDPEQRKDLFDATVLHYSDRSIWVGLKKWLLHPISEEDIEELNRKGGFKPKLTYIGENMNLFMTLNQAYRGMLYLAVISEPPIRGGSSHAKLNQHDRDQLLGRPDASDHTRQDEGVPEVFRSMSRTDAEKMKTHREAELDDRVRRLLDSTPTPSIYNMLLNESNFDVVQRMLVIANDQGTEERIRGMIKNLLKFKLKSTKMVKKRGGIMESVDVHTPLFAALLTKEPVRAIVSTWSSDTPLMLDNEIRLMAGNLSSAAA